MSNESFQHCVPCFGLPPDLNKYRQFSFIIIGIVLPVVALIGVVFNLTSIVVLSRPRMRCSINCLLCALAASDMFVSTTAMSLYSLLIMECSGPIVSNLHSTLAPYMYPLSTIVQTCSVYFTLAAAIDCFVSTVIPCIEQSVCTVKRAQQVIGYVCMFALIYNLSHFFELERWECFEPEWNTTISRLKATDFRRNELYYQIYYTYSYTIFMAVGPLILLIALNSVIVVKTVLIKRPQNKRESPSTESSTTTLILVVFLFIICNALSLAVNLLELIDRDSWLLGYLVDVSNLLVVFNSSANFLIYFTFDSQFRMTLYELCGRGANSVSHASDGDGERDTAVIWHEHTSNYTSILDIKMNLYDSALFSRL